MSRLAAAAACLFGCLLFADGSTRGRAVRDHSIPVPGEAELALYSSYKAAAKGKALKDLDAWTKKAEKEAAAQASLLSVLQERQLEYEQQQQQQQEQQPQEQKDIGFAEALMRTAALAAEFQKMRIDRILAEEDPEIEVTANEQYTNTLALPEALSVLDASVVRGALSASPSGSALLPFVRTPSPFNLRCPKTAALFASFSSFISSYNIRQKTGGKGYDLNIQQALCIAQTDPEPERRRGGVCVGLVIGSRWWWSHHHRSKRATGYSLSFALRAGGSLSFAGLPTEDTFYGNHAIMNAIKSALDSGGCGLYKRVLRIRKHVFIRSKEGTRFGWGDRLALGQPSTAGEGPEYEEAFNLVVSSLASAAPPLADLLSNLTLEKRVEVDVGEAASRVTLDCPYEPSPLGLQLEGVGLTSPLTGTLLSYHYTAEAGAPGLAHFLWRHLMVAKLQELNPLMASFAAVDSGSSSSGSRSLLTASNSLLIESLALWGRHLAFTDDINAVFNPQQQLRLLLSYLDETLGRIVKGSLRRAFGVKLRDWARSKGDAAALEKAWLRVFRDHFGAEGDVFDTYGGVRSQWLLFDSLEEVIGGEGSNIAETLGYVSAPPKPVHVLGFVALNKVANDCFFIKDYRKAQTGRRPTQEVIAEAFNSFVADAEAHGFVEALTARGAQLQSSKYWNAAIHELVEKSFDLQRDAWNVFFVLIFLLLF
ncbi:hypothetical protein Efla_001601 [Eimeria flavescens]